MGRAIAILSNSAAALLPRPYAGLGQAVAKFLREMTRNLVSPYRPELHYMRGPGPACRAKYGNHFPG